MFPILHKPQKYESMVHYWSLPTHGTQCIHHGVCIDVRMVFFLVDKEDNGFRNKCVTTHATEFDTGYLADSDFSAKAFSLPFVSSGLLGGYGV